jgi:hypothetical protein
MTSSKKKQKRLHYRRAVWVPESDTQEVKNTLEYYLELSHAETEIAQNLTFSFGDHEIACADRRLTSDGFYLHLATYSPGGDTSTIVKDSSLRARAISPEPAPQGKDYLHGDIFILVKDNHVLLCPSGARENIAIKYFIFILEKLNKKFSAASFNLAIIANVDKLNMIKNEGVREIVLNSSIYEASKHFIEKNDPKFSGLIPNIVSDLKRIFSEDKDLKNIQQDENINVSLTIRFDGKEKQKNLKNPTFGSVGLKRLTAASRKILDDIDDFNDGNFEIVTYNNHTITANETQVSEEYSIDKHGNSINKDATWITLKTYYDKLKGSGILEQ